MSPSHDPSTVNPAFCHCSLVFRLFRGGCIAGCSVSATWTSAKIGVWQQQIVGGCRLLVQKNKLHGPGPHPQTGSQLLGVPFGPRIRRSRRLKIGTCPSGAAPTRPQVLKLAACGARNVRVSQPRRYVSDVTTLVQADWDRSRLP